VGEGQGMIDVQALLDTVDLVSLVERESCIQLKKRGKDEWIGCCPFHSERTPSFHVVPDKQFMHCFGCGIHYNAIGYVMALYGYEFIEACHKLGGHDMRAKAKHAVQTAPRRRENPSGELWVPVYPVPDFAPAWVAGVKGRVWNLKREGWWDVTPLRADAYRAANGAVMGYVLRVEMPDKKITPAVTWCIGPRGDGRWCLQPFPDPRPLFGLEGLAAKPDAPVLMLEGEKCAHVGAETLPMYAAMTWMGGSHGVRHADFSPLAGRDVVLWPDADAAGERAMLGYFDGSGLLHEGVAQRAYRAGCKSLRMVDVHGMPQGWDIADARRDGWTAKQIAAWARARVRPVEMIKLERASV